jgi:hypothetical protein
MHLRVASPCKEDWSKMVGDDRVRFCAGCKLNVYNLSSMTDAEVKELVGKREGRVCARFYQRADGTVLTRDCPTGVRRKRQVLGVSLATVASLLALPVAAAPSHGSGRLMTHLRNLVIAVKARLSPTPPMMGDISVVR